MFKFPCFNTSITLDTSNRGFSKLLLITINPYISIIVSMEYIAIKIVRVVLKLPFTLSMEALIIPILLSVSFVRVSCIELDTSLSSFTTPFDTFPDCIAFAISFIACLKSEFILFLITLRVLISDDDNLALLLLILPSMRLFIRLKYTLA